MSVWGLFIYRKVIRIPIPGSIDKCIEKLLYFTDKEKDLFSIIRKSSPHEFILTETDRRDRYRTTDIAFIELKEKELLIHFEKDRMSLLFIFGSAGIIAFLILASMLFTSDQHFSVMPFGFISGFYILSVILFSYQTKRAETWIKENILN